ncbi:MAG: M23 family metallopeptidase [Bacteroidetes bacterium]|nr:M23 family metallopeptidase [Bacteroidota bacterium]
MPFYLRNILFILGFFLFASASDGNEKSGSEKDEEALVNLIQQSQLSKEKLVYLVDSLLNGDTISYCVLDALNKKLASEAFYHLPIDTNPPSHDLYCLWDTENPNSHAELPLNDTAYNFELVDKLNDCGFAMPVNGIITSLYGYRDGKMHNGIDIALKTGDPVVSAFRGMVRVARYYGSFGNVVVIRHYNGFETVYAHLSKISVKPGDMVDPGQLIGKGGNTGRSRGAHLHFELRFKGYPVNPRYVIDLEKKTILSETVVVRKTKTGFTAFPEGTIFHTIKRGDYLYKVATQYGITVKQLCAWNGLHKKSSLVAGMKLKVSQ